MVLQPGQAKALRGGAPALRSSSAVGATATQASGRGVLRRSESAREQGSCAPLSLYSSRRAIDMPPELDARRIVELTQAIDALLLTSEPTPSLDEVIASAVPTAQSRGLPSSDRCDDQPRRSNSRGKKSLPKTRVGDDAVEREIVPFDLRIDRVGNYCSARLRAVLGGDTGPTEPR